MTSSDGTAAGARHERIVQALREDFGRLFGLPPAQVDPEQTFTALGADSLFLLRASRGVQDRFGVRVPFRKLLSETNTVRALADLLDREIPADEAPAAPAPLAASAAPLALAAPQAVAVPAIFTAEGGALRRVLEQQLRLMSLQLDALRGGAPSAEVPASPVPAQSAPAAAREPTPAPASAAADDAVAEDEEIVLDAAQAEHLDALVARLSARTAGSRRAAEDVRASLAGAPGTPRFRLPWKALCHPLQVERGEGGRVWDVDGNEYVDLSLAGGALLFGHTPPFLAQAVRDALADGLRAGTRTALAGEVAAQVRRMTGAERVCFVDSRTEAVMVALRLARAVTERSRIAVFAGADHGAFDGTLARRLGLAGSASALPCVPGVPRAMVRDVAVLPSADDAALETLRGQGQSVAAVLVDAARLGAEGGAFVRALRELCTGTGAALVLDETTTGFRVHPGGAQALFGVRADLAVYGGVPGSGLPLGIVAGGAPYLAPVDGGEWSAGDGSYPLVPTTRAGGTAGEHPVTLAAARAALAELARDAALDGVHRHAAALAAELRGVFGRAGAPVRVEHFGPDVRLRFPAAMRAVDEELFHLHLREQGVQVGDDRVLRLSTAHSEADVRRVAAAAGSAVAALTAAGFLGGRAEPVRELPLAGAQRDLWFLSQLSDEASRACNESVILRLRGRCDVEAVRAAVRELVARHDTLRTEFAPQGTVQRVHPRLYVEVPVVEVDGDDAEAALSQALETEVHRPCDLARAPILRARLYRVAEDDHVLALVLHHLVTDGWSNGLIAAELRALYAAAAEGRTAALPAPARAAAEAEDADALAYWAERLADAPAVLDLPTDRPRPARQGFAGALERQELSAGLRQRLARLGEANGATLYAVLLAAFHVFLHRVTGADDLVAGAIAAGRGRDEGATAVGCMVDVLPLRSRPRGEPAFAAFVRDVQARLLDAMDHRGVPLGALAEALGRRRDPARPALVAAVLNLHRGHAGGFPFGAARAEAVTVHNGGAKFELALTAVETDTGMRLEWEYRTALFDAETIRAWGDAFQALLESAADAPETGIWSLDLLGADARRTMDEWAGTPRTAPAGPSLAERVATRAEEDPTAIALRWEGGEMTRRDLHDRSARLASRLRSMGVETGARVAICLERGPGMVVGMLGAVMAGAAYVPVDPDHPAARRRQVLDDSAAAVVLTQSRFADELAEGAARVLELDAEWDALAHGPVEPAAAAHPEQAVYVLYTSGSTGPPKGVEIPHRALLNHMEWMERDYPLAGGRVLQKTPFGFDASVWEFWAPLLEGGTLVMARPGGHRDPAYLVQTLRREAITTLQLVPSLLRALLEEPGLERCTALRRVFVGGEALERALVARLRERLVVDVVNLYGPTEACIDSVVHRCTGEGAAPGEPIGRPVPGVLAYVVDPRGRPVPACVPGELCLGGVALAHGYPGRPALTAERFVPDPFSGTPGARLYRTGDRVRRRADGVLEYMERTDFQVKVRGFRIEPGEIEAALRADRRVREVAVLARGTGEQAALVAYLACAQPAPTPAELRAALGERLPEYMVPSAFVVLDRLPLSPSGKLDRAALPEPDAGALAVAQAYTAPRTPAEAAVAGIWAAVLGVDRVGAHDDFFALGGHSLRATRVLARVDERFGVALPLRALFDHPTVAALAATIEAQRPAEDDERLRLERLLAEIEGLPLDLAEEAASAD